MVSSFRCLAAAEWHLSSIEDIAGELMPLYESVCCWRQGRPPASVTIWSCANSTPGLYVRVRPALQHVADRLSFGIAPDDRSTIGLHSLLWRGRLGLGIWTSHATGATRDKASRCCRSRQVPHQQVRLGSTGIPHLAGV